jgi:methylated-DNA-[protein]-cysteine S-methyltransferase
MASVSPFAKKVYAVVSRIPFGEVRSYRWVACRAGNPGAARAVGTLMKNNPCPLLIPCHRVIKNNGTIGGYVWGAKRKKLLLDLEKEIKACLENKR